MISAVEVGFPTQRNTTREVQVEQTGGRLRYFLVQGSTQRRDRHQHHLKRASSTRVCRDKNNNGGRLAPHRGPFRGRTCVSRPTKDTRNDNAANVFEALLQLLYGIELATYETKSGNTESCPCLSNNTLKHSLSYNKRGVGFQCGFTSLGVAGKCAVIPE